jgi:hypothetical protein
MDGGWHSRWLDDSGDGGVARMRLKIPHPCRWLGCCGSGDGDCGGGGGGGDGVAGIGRDHNSVADGDLDGGKLSG